MSERDIQAEILKALGSRPDVRLFRNQAGVMWAGAPKVIAPGQVLLTNARRYTCGLATGAADLIGLQAVEIDGQKIARFVSIEVKSKTGKLTAEQAAWLAMVKRFGGYAVVARSLSDIEL